MNYLRPNIKRGNFTREEDETILRMHEIMGNKWSAMAAALPGRTDNDIKNHWHSRLKKHSREPRTRSQVSSGEAKLKNSSETNFLLPNNDPEASRSDGSFPTTVPAFGIEENHNIEENLGYEPFENENQDLPLEMFVDPGFMIPQGELWGPDQPMSPFVFYNDPSWWESENLMSIF